MHGKVLRHNLAPCYGACASADHKLLSEPVKEVCKLAVDRTHRKKSDAAAASADAVHNPSGIDSDGSGVCESDLQQYKRGPVIVDARTCRLISYGKRARA